MVFAELVMKSSPRLARHQCLRGNVCHFRAGAFVIHVTHAYRAARQLGASVKLRWDLGAADRNAGLERRFSQAA